MKRKTLESGKINLGVQSGPKFSDDNKFPGELPDGRLVGIEDKTPNVGIIGGGFDVTASILELFAEHAIPVDGRLSVVVAGDVPHTGLKNSDPLLNIVLNDGKETR